MYKKIIKEAFNHNKLAVFVGSGVSKNSNLPDWKDLVDKLKKELKTEENDFLKVAQLYYLAVGKTTYLQNIKKIFDIKARPNSIHKYIFDLRPKYIITTNWDRLLEQYIFENTTHYKIVSSDKDLVASNIDKMIIKMHGDFHSEKFVFKEDDYINYSKNFPLIENFIKSILSTHTVIFIGYSYSDINIKYITKWIQNSSNLQPPMFYLSFQEDMYQEKYLKNYKIDTILIPKYDRVSDYLYRLERFLKELTEYANEKSVEIDRVDFKNADDLKSLLDFIYNKLKVLKNQTSPLRKQILELLKECHFQYVDKKTHLDFYTDELTRGFSTRSKSIREIYKYFIDFLYKKDEILRCFESQDIESIEKKLKSIFDILIHANIDGIVVKKEDRGFIPYIFSSRCPNSVFGFYKNIFQDRFDLLDEYSCTLELKYNIYCSYQKREYKNAFNLNKKLISKCFESDDYINLLFAYFNHNQLIDMMREPIFIDEKFKKDLSETTPYRLKKYDIDEKFDDLPVEVRSRIKTLKRFLSIDFIYDLYIEIDSEYHKKKEQENSIKKKEGGFLDSNVDRFYAHQKELVLFYTQNLLLLDYNFKFRQITEKLCEIELVRTMTHKRAEFDIYQLYSYIHLIDKKSFENLFSKFITDEKLKNKLYIEIRLQNWLLNLLKNNYELFKGSSTILSFNRSNEITNIIFLLSLVKLDENVYRKLFDIFILMIKENRGNYDLYKSLSKFFKIQNIKHKTLLDKKITVKYYESVIKTLIDYFDNKQQNHWIYEAFKDGYLDISYISKQKLFNNTKLIKEFFKKINSLEFNLQQIVVLAFLLGLGDISKSKTKKLVSKYLLNLYKKIDRVDIKLYFYLLYIKKGILPYKKKSLKRYLKLYSRYLLKQNEFFYIYAIVNNLKLLIEDKNIKNKYILKYFRALEKIDLKKHIPTFYHI